MGAPPMGAPPMGGPIQPQMPPGGPIQPQMPPGQQPMGQPGQFAPANDPLAGLAAKVPMSKPGTLFGIPLDTLRDQQFEQKALLIMGVLLAIGIVLPFHTSPNIFAWSEGMPKFRGLVWPIVAAACYILVALSPQAVRQNVPPVVMKWIPFGVSLASIGIVGYGLFFMVGGGLPTNAMLMLWGYPILCFGLLARLSQPDDQIARIIIGVGVGLMLPGTIEFVFDHAFKFSHVPALLVIHNLLFVVVLLVCMLCAVFVVKPSTVPALRSVDAFAPLFTAVILGWLLVQVVLLMLVALVHQKGGAVGDLLMGIHMFIATFAFFGILMLTAPEAYDQAKAMFSGHQAAVATGQVPQGPYAPQQPQQPYQGGPVAPAQPGQPVGGPIQPQMPPQGMGGPPPPAGPPGGGGGWPPQGGGQQ